MMQIVTNDQGEMYPYAEDEISKGPHSFKIARDFLNRSEQKELIRWLLKNRVDLFDEVMKELLNE